MLLIATGWLVAAAAATAVGLAAIDTLGAGLLDRPDGNAPLRPADVDRLLAGETTTPGPAGGPSGAAPSPAAPTGPAIKVLTSPGGTIHATCADGKVTMTSWSPAQGYRADDPEPGPATEASIKFKRGKDEMRVVVTCAGADPTATVIPDDD